MVIKISYHIMPWEIDYAHLSFIQLKKSKYHLPENTNIQVETVLNLSSYILDWESSKLPKEFFIEKYNQISKLLSDYTHIKRTYQGDELYGHLDLQREAISEEIDYYIALCPDMYFNETLLGIMTQAAEQINNKYFVITPQISKLWDSSWDILVNPLYQDIPYSTWYETDSFDIIHNDYYNLQELKLQPMDSSKYAGWFDLYNKAFYEELVPVWDEWKGYGSWDWYTLMVTEVYKAHGGDFQQYLLEGKTIFEYSTGVLQEGFGNYYKKFLSLNQIPDQKELFKAKVPEYANQRIQQLIK
jgi:hypothetical protein